MARRDCHVHAAPGLHPPPRRDAISAIFTRKASRPIPAARSSNKARHPRYAAARVPLGIRACSRRNSAFRERGTVFSLQFVASSPFVSRLGYTDLLASEKL